MDIPTDVPTSARSYGYMLGSKDNYDVDRRFVLNMLEMFPSGVDVTRQNRLFLYRAVRYLTEEAGIRQFIDMGCGLPTDNNVHQVARRSAPDARVVYVDIDPVVLAHGRALLATDPATSLIAADIRDQDAVLETSEVKQLIDFDEPLAVLFLSVGHHLLDADDPRRILSTVIDRAAPGSHLGFTQVVCEDPERRDRMTRQFTAAGLPWQTRSPEEAAALLPDLETVEPGLTKVLDWRPDPTQPSLDPVPTELGPYIGRSQLDKDLYEYGGLLRKP